MENSNGIPTVDDKFWRDQILESLNFKGPDPAYCESKGLNLSVFRTQKRKLGFTHFRRRKKREFVRVETLPESGGSKILTELPDPRWFAEVIKHLHGSR